LDFIEWFIGFSEGDGSSILSSYKNRDGTLALNSRHFFVISQKEPQVLYRIRTTLGFGSVREAEDKAQGTTHYRYVVSDLENVERSIYIFNGNFVLKKTQERFKI